jgi:hypothetical protein
MATDTQEVRMLLREALDAVRPNLKELGDEAGLTHHAIDPPRDPPIPSRCPYPITPGAPANRSHPQTPGKKT